MPSPAPENPLPVTVIVSPAAEMSADFETVTLGAGVSGPGSLEPRLPSEPNGLVLRCRDAHRQRAGDRGGNRQDRGLC